MSNSIRWGARLLIFARQIGVDAVVVRSAGLAAANDAELLRECAGCGRFAVGSRDRHEDFRGAVASILAGESGVRERPKGVEFWIFTTEFTKDTERPKEVPIGYTSDAGRAVIGRLTLRITVRLVRSLRL